ncbi:MAG: tetratricopeptide repeat protein [Flavobacteriales bacterium]|nr:tetratricopeptide repeat protein [Flavobacteriales bacterium]
MKLKSWLIFSLILLCTFSKAQEHNCIVDSFNIIAKNILQENADSSLFLSEKALEFALKKKCEIGQAISLNSIASAYYQKGDYLKTVEIVTQALKIAGKINAKKEIIIAKITMAKISKQQKKYDKGLQISRQALHLAETENDSVNISNALDIIGIFHKRLGETDSAIYYHKKAIEINKKIDYKKGLSFNYNNLAIIYARRKDYKKAGEYFEKSLLIRYEIGNPLGIIQSYNNLGYLQFLQQNYTTAIPFFKKSLGLSYKAKILNEVPKYLVNIYTSYENLGDYKNAYNYYAEYISINDSILNVETRISIEKKEAELSAQLLIEEQELLEIEELTEKRELNQKLVLIGFLLIALFVLFVLTINASNKKNIIKSIAEKDIQKKEIDLQEKIRTELINSTVSITEDHEQIKERIAKELHDGLGGTLASIRINLSQIQKENEFLNLQNSIQEIDAIYQKVRSISHSLTPPTLKGSSFSNILKDYLQNQFENTSIQLVIDLLPKKELNKLESNIKLAVYRILQELCENIVSYANATKVNIHIIAHENYLSLLIEDNGIGIENSKKIPDNKGISLCADRLKLIDGTMYIDSEKARGTTIDIRIPISKKTI